MRKTKIVATLGPISDSEETIRRLILAGVDAFRFNFSHGTHQQHLIAYHRCRAAAEQVGKTVALIMDLQGPKIRVGELENDQVELSPGETTTLTSRRIRGSAERVPVVYEQLEADVKPDELILMDDGRLRLRALDKSAEGVRCRILEGGTLKPHKGVNFPGTNLSLPGLTKKDMEDLGFGIQLGFDCVALSFVSAPEDVLRVRECMHDIGAVRPIISKLERAACLDRLGAVMDVSDAVMVARGDLGVEVDIKRVPVLQKQIIAEANLHGIPVITATQMLESMTVGLLPTRAEAADVANAVFDGTDALMLSGETSVGRYPVQSVEMMANIIEEAESFHLGDENMRWANQRLRGKGVGEAICHTAVVAAHDLGLKAIIVVTRSGQTALDVAKFRPPAVVHAFAFDPVVHNFLALTRGVSPHLCTYMTDFEPLMDMIDKIMIDDKIAEPGEAVAMVLGVPVGEHAGSNTLTIHNVGEKFSTGYTCSPLEGSL